MNIRPKVSVSCVSKIYFGDFGCSCDFLLDLFPPLWMSFQCLFFLLFYAFFALSSLFISLSSSLFCYLFSLSVCILFYFWFAFSAFCFSFVVWFYGFARWLRDSECVACCVCLRYLYTGYCSEIFSVSELFRFNRSVFGFWFSVYFMYVNRRLAEGY